MPTACPSVVIRSASRLKLIGVAASLLSLAGCADLATDLGAKSSAPATIAPKVEKVAPVTKTGRPVAVLSVHMRKSYPNACKYGMTLTNNLPFKITNLTFRLTAIIKGNVPFETQNKNFFELPPTQQQYSELTFQGVTCQEIDRIEVTDPGRCALGDLNRFNAQPGDCAKFSEVAGGRLVKMVKKQS